MREVSIHFDLNDVRDFLIQQARQRGIYVPEDAYVALDVPAPALGAGLAMNNALYAPPTGLKLHWFPPKQ